MNTVKKANKLNDDPTKTNAKLTGTIKKMRKATSKKDTAVSQKETGMPNLASTASAVKNKKIKKELLDAKKESSAVKNEKIKKELLDAKKELTNTKKEVENPTRKLSNNMIPGHQGVILLNSIERRRGLSSLCLRGRL